MGGGGGRFGGRWRGGGGRERRNEVCMWHREVRGASEDRNPIPFDSF